MEHNYTNVLEFIDSEIYDESALDIPKTFRCFCKCYTKTLIDLDLKFNASSYTEYFSYIIYGANIMNNIFWLVLSYTSNLKLTIFLAERSILLFTEFLLIAKNKNVSRQLLFTPNMNDVIEFVFQRTIGDLKINNNNHATITNAGLSIKAVFEQCFTDLFKKKDTSNSFDFIMAHISPSMLSLYELLGIEVNFFIRNIINKIFETDYTTEIKLYILKNILDTVLKLGNKNIDINIIIEITNNTIDALLENLNTSTSIQENIINKRLITQHFTKIVKQNT